MDSDIELQIYKFEQKINDLKVTLKELERLIKMKQSFNIKENANNKNE